MIVAHNATKAFVLVLVLCRAGQVGLERTLSPIGGIRGHITSSATQVLVVWAVVSKSGNSQNWSNSVGFHSKSFLIII